MRKILHYFALISLVFFSLQVSKVRAQVPPKARAFLTMAGYGAAGGALLGVATMAFGNSTRAVAQGASLGLYAGIIFGTYVLVAHHQRQTGFYDDKSSPYQESTDVYGDEYNSEEGGSSGGGDGFFNRIEILREQVNGQSFTFDSQRRRTRIPPIHINFLQLEF
jgi:hypothetical protein